jgi:hypothetical protein
VGAQANGVINERATFRVVHPNVPSSDASLIQQAVPEPRAWGLWRGLIVALALAHSIVYLQPFEDSFITYRYARNVARGLGFVFNAGERVEGYTSFLWTVLLSVVSWLDGSLLLTSQALSIGAGLLIVHLATRLVSLSALSGSVQGGQSLLRLAPALWLACSGTLAYYAMTGMETTLFCALLLAAVLLLSRAELALWCSLTAGLVLALAALTRPEGFGYALCVIGALLWSRDDRKRALQVCGAFSAVFIPYFLWRYTYFGYLAPNTYYAKASASGALLVQGAAYLEGALIGRGLLIPFAACLIDAAVQRDKRNARLRGAMVIGALVNSFMVGGDIFRFYRFLLPAMPFAYASLALMFERRFSRLERRQGLVTVLAVCGFTTVLVATELLPISTFTRSRKQSDFAYARSNAEIVYGYFEVGQFLREHVVPGSWLATNAAGVVPYESDLPTIDMLGLTDEHIAHMPIELGHGALGHEKYDANYVLSRKPDLIFLGLPTVAPAHFQAHDLGRWNARTLGPLPGDRALLEHPRFAREYRPLFITTDGGPIFVYVRLGRETVLH